MSKLKCPKCGSTRLYQEISLVAKQKLNIDKNGRQQIYDRSNMRDNSFETIHCDKCDWNDLINPSPLRYGENCTDDYEI